MFYCITTSTEWWKFQVMDFQTLLNIYIINHKFTVNTPVCLQYWAYTKQM